MNTYKIFEGDSFQSSFARIIYKRLKDRLWVSYGEVMAEYCMEDYTLDYKVSVRDGYSELKKVFPKVIKAIKNAQGENCIEEEGTNRNRRYKYIGEAEEPLADLLHAKVIDDITQYWQFCQDSAGFFPSSWLDYFFRDSRDLLEIKTKKKRGEQIIGTGMDRALNNIEILPDLYNYISRKQVLAIDYKPYNEELQLLVFHPHYLREYNGRWFLFGYADGDADGYTRNLALDRIVGKPREQYNVDYRPAPKGYYEDLFRNIIGVSHTKSKDSVDSSLKVWPITIRAYGKTMFGLVNTKKFHSPQPIVTPYGQHPDGEYGEFQINVEVNNELIGTILHYGCDLEVMSPPEVRQIFKKKVEAMKLRYADKLEDNETNGIQE